jgi:hypothetical protein
MVQSPSVQHTLTEYEFSRRSRYETSLLLVINIVTCLRHAAIVETQKSVNTLRNNRGKCVFSVPFRAAGGRAVSIRAALHHARFQGNSVVNTVTTQKYCLWTWPDITELTGSVFRFAVSGYKSEAVSSFSSVLRSEFAESVLGESFEVCYEDY